MRVIEQARLAFREGTSDKLYEVDLVEVVAGQYVVNFRFGRRGSALRDGTKTPTPVPLAKARAIFEKLVAEKTAGGYSAQGSGGGGGASPPPARPAPRRIGGDDDDDADDDAAGAGAPGAPSEQDRALIARLRQGTRGEGELGPVVWKAGDRDLRAAEPALLELIDARPRSVQLDAWQHTVIGALVRCGTTASLARLTQFASGGSGANHVRDVARLAIVRIDPSRAEALARPLLTHALTTALERRDAAGLARAAEELLASDPVKARVAAVGLYLLDRPADRATPAAGGTASAAPQPSLVRPAVLAFARVARVSNAEAAVVRTLYRLAELRRDGELFALCARRIDDSTEFRRPFGPPTREYFRRRTARVLRRLARAESPDYAAMAAAVLLSYSDDDAQEPRHGEQGGHWDRFARYHALNETIYGKSPRYARAHHQSSAWACSGSYRPGGPAPAEREERYPALWDRAPDALWRLLGAARATPVIEFAGKALRANRGYVDRLSDEAIAAVLGGGHPIAQRAVYELVKHRPLSTALVRGALASQVGEAHVWVLLWIASHPDRVVGDPEILAMLLTGGTPAIRDAGEALLRDRALPADVARSTAIRAIAILIGLADAPADGEGPAARAAAAVALLVRRLPGPLGELPGDVLRDLIRHPLAALGELAGEAMLRHARRDELPPDLIELLLASPHPSVRLLGGRLLATTPIDVAKDDPEALELFATSANRELREGTRSLLGELARLYPAIARALADRLVDLLLKPQPDGVPAHIVSLLRTELAPALPHKSGETILKLIGALSPHAREAGGLLMGQLAPDELGLDDLARLASHEIEAIRQGAWSLARASVDRYRLAPVALSRLVDSPWDDTREFAIGFIRGELAEALTADAIIAICDSIRPEVQALGKALLHERFATSDAGRYLVRLAEHPSTNLQLLVSGLLEHHIGTDLDRLRALAPYLTTVLSQVNRGKVAKQRVMGLLRREAPRSPEAAAVLLPILDRQSATIAISQKHPLIATLVEVHAAYPDLPVPITVVPPGPHGPPAPHDPPAPGSSRGGS